MNSEQAAQAPGDVTDPVSGLSPLGHEYDGIQEFDNRLPNWWLFTLYAAIVFGFGYWIYYHTLDRPGFQEVFAQQWAAVEKAQADKAGSIDLAALAKDPDAVARGKVTFANVCAACHRADGGGLVGPNLTDSAWIHGSAPKDIMKTVSEGFVAKGMPPWGPVLGPKGVAEVTAFVLTLKDTNVAGGKPPQGPAPSGTEG